MISNLLQRVQQLSLALSLVVQQAADCQGSAQTVHAGRLALGVFCTIGFVLLSVLREFAWNINNQQYVDAVLWHIMQVCMCHKRLRMMTLFV
jgi:hypothetical protein